MRKLREMQWILYYFMIGAVMIGALGGIMWLADSGIPVAEPLAKAMAFGFCVLVVLWLCIQSAIWNSGWKVGKISGKLESPWEVAYQQQLASSLIRERRIG